MIERTFSIDNAEIAVTFQWENGGGPGVPAGWGENTGVQIKTAGLSIFILFDVDDEKPVAEWAIDDVQVIRDRQFFADLTAFHGNVKPVLNLGTMPEVCELVTTTWQQVKAQEAVEIAGEDCYGFESEISDLEYQLHPTEGGVRPGHPQRSEYELRLEEACKGLEEAKAKHERLKAEYAEQYPGVTV